MKRLAFLIVLATVAALAAQTGKTAPQKPAAKAATKAAPSPTPAKVTGPPQTTPSGVEYWDIKVGNGKTAVDGKKLTMHYTGWLTNGKKFDSSYDRDQPFEFVLGTRYVIKGWDEGVAGMKAGGKRQLKIPAAAGYGERGAPPKVPPNATLIFDVELLDVK